MKKLLCITALGYSITAFTMDNTLHPMNKVQLDEQAMHEFIQGMQTTFETGKKIIESNNAVSFYHTLEPWIQSYEPHLSYTTFFNMQTRYTLDELFDLHEQDETYQQLYKNALEKTKKYQILQRTKDQLMQLSQEQEIEGDQDDEHLMNAWNSFRIGANHVGKKILESKGVRFQQNPSSRSYEEFLRANKDLPENAQHWLLAGNIILYYLRQIQRTQSPLGCPEIIKK